MARFGSFSADLGAFTGKTLDRYNRTKRGVGIALFGAVIDAAPVGDPDLWANAAMAQRARDEGYTGGRFRANWNVSIGTPDKSQTSETIFAGDQMEMAAVVNASGAKDTLILTNSLPYAGRLEYDGHSSQAKKGTVRVNVARFTDLLRGVLRRVKSS